MKNYTAQFMQRSTKNIRRNGLCRKAQSKQQKHPGLQYEKIRNNL